MKNFFVLWAAITAVTLAACSDAQEIPDGTPVGLVRLNLTDPLRTNWEETGPRPLTTSIWYPATEGSEMEEIGIPPNRPVFIGGFAARDAKLPIAPERFPLIIISHGTGGAGMQMMWLGRALAEQGYIVAAVDHHGNTAAEDSFDPRGFRMPWERPRDISAVLDLLLAHPDWAPRIDASNIGAVGFSLGGYTVTALAGARLDFDLFIEFCQSSERDATCDEQSEFPDAGKQFEAMLEADPDLAARMGEHNADYSDNRIHAVITLAPAIASALTEESLAKIEIPYLSIVGELDDIAPAATNANRLAEYIPGAQIVLLSGSDHYSFINRCNSRGQRFVPICKDPADTSRAQIHEQTIGHALEFFQVNLNK